MTTPTLPIAPDAPWLAPLAGFSDLAFRLLCREYGAAACVTEMVSAKGLIYDSPGSRDLLATTREDSPLVAQLFGAHPDTMARAMDILLAGGPGYFDLNAGCPAPKVVKTGAGAALLKFPGLLVNIARAMARSAGPGRCGVKLRLGWRRDEPVLHELLPRLEDAGAAWLAIHPRFASDGFSGAADREAVASLRRRTTLPLIYSGDLFSAEDAANALRETRADGVMFARGALADPGVFHRLRALMRGETPAAATPASVAALARRYAALAARHGNPHAALLKMRTVIPRFARGLSGARALRKQLSSCTSWEALYALIETIETSEPGAIDAAGESRAAALTP
ncbi:MAG: tRNA-dihydrouridine synthase family protein [Desulfovibrionaceae bacterium]|nr:tRNA-dihydrouridine synthase family protein [Desulfovibrionaceae bacterium]MBF0514017.1 tRNA-dihydrouridine synthase family protein [Desulfovibrionaceae bacterium]